MGFLTQVGHMTTKFGMMVRTTLYGMVVRITKIGVEVIPTYTAKVAGIIDGSSLDPDSC